MINFAFLHLVGNNPATCPGELLLTKYRKVYLMTKILKVLLPLFNYSQINKFKGQNTVSKEIFNKATLN